MPAVRFTAPWSLLLLIGLVPLVLLARHSLAGLSTRRWWLAASLRCGVYAALVLALAGTQVVWRVKATSVVYVVDRSDSLNDADRARALAFVQQAEAGMGADDTAGVVVTGRYALVEKTPLGRLRLPQIDSQPDPQFTDLAAGLRLGAATVRPDARRRLVLLSDGNENLGDAVGEARLARAGGIAIDIVPLRHDRQGEVVADRLVLPPEVRRGDTVEPRLVVRTDTPTTAQARLYRDNALVGEASARLSPGKNVIAFPSVAMDQDGFQRYTAEVTPEVDHDRRNNRALGFCFVRGRHKVLYVEGDRGQQEPLRRALTENGLNLRTVGPAGLPTSLPQLADYDSLILSNVSALDLSDTQMSLIRSAVRDLGVGLVMIGGPDSFGVGGYYQTPIEEALPVDMDIRKLRHLPNVGVAVVIDKSGSMAMTEGGTEKIQLANEAAIALVSLLGPRDQVSVIAVDSVAKPVTGPKLMPVTRKEALIEEISRIRAGGGGIYCYEGLKKAAELLRPADTKLKHIILFADATDSEQQEHCVDLAKRLANEKITVSVIGLGREGDGHVPFQKDVAKAGGGRFYLTHQASALPRIFTREALLASRSQLVERTFTPLAQSDIEPLRGITSTPPLHGYVATTAKPAAEVGWLADPKHKDPLLAVWQYGLGRSAAFTSDCKPHWAVDWLGWPGYAKFWTQLVRWSIRRTQRGDFETRVFTRFQADPDEIAAWHLRRGEARVVVDAVDQQGEFVNQLTLHGSAVAPDGTTSDLTLRQTAAGRYEASFAVQQVGVYLVNIAGGQGAAAGSQTVGLALPWPPEYGDTRSNDTVLSRVAEVSGGRELQAPGEVFQPRGEPARASRDIWAMLLALALALFPLDVAVRRLMVSPAQARAWLRRRRPMVEAAPADEAPRATGALLARKARGRRQPAPTAPPPARLQAQPSEPTAPGSEVEPTGETATRRLLAQRSQRREQAPAADQPAATEPPRPGPPPAAVPPPPRPVLPAEPTTTPVERDVTDTLARLKAARRRRSGDPPDGEAP